MAIKDQKPKLTLKNNKMTELFSEKTSEEIEKFETESGGIVLFNQMGENALSLQKNGDSFLLYPDRITSHHIGESPELFSFSNNDVCRLFNFLAEIINENPEVYNLDTKALMIENELKQQNKSGFTS